MSPTLAVWIGALLVQAEPSPAELKIADAEIRDLFKADLASSDPERKRELAQTLVVHAKDPQASPASRRALLDLARDLGAELFAFGLAFDAIDVQQRLFRRPPGALSQKLALVTLARTKARAPDDLAAVADAFLKLGRAALSAGEFDLAATAADAASKAAPDPDARAQGVELAKEIPELREERRDVLRAQETLASKPDDPDASLVYGRYLLFEGSDEKRALSLLQKGSHAGLREVAALEAAGPSDAPSLSELADAWWFLGETETSPLRSKRCFARARDGYERALADAPGLLAIRVQGRLDEAEKRPPLACAPPTIELLRRAEPKKHAFAGQWERAGSRVRVVKGSFSRLELPYEPPEDYDLSAVYEAGRSTEVVLLCARRGKGFAVSLYPGQNRGAIYHSGPKVDLAGLDLAVDRPHAVQVQVRGSGIRVFVDGKEAADWAPRQSELRHHVAWTPRNPRLLGIGANGEPVTFLSIRVSDVTGRGRTVK